tara:strand:+ start:62 stop:2035 length:1974 start_codon:yes stop_codon:yes gene_type:complete
LNIFKKNIIGSLFALSLIIPPNVGLNFFGINYEDMPLIFVFIYLSYKRFIASKKLDFKKFDYYFWTFILIFVFYTTLNTDQIRLFNQTNFRFYFYFILSYLIVHYATEPDTIIRIFEAISFVMVANFIVVIFQIQIDGDINGWIMNNSESKNFLTSGRLGGLQGGGPNVIGIICAISVLITIYKILNSKNKKDYIFKNKYNTLIFLLSFVNLVFTFSRGSYLALFIGLCFLTLTSKNLSGKFKTYFLTSLFLSSFIVIAISPSLFLKQSNRTFLNSLALEQVSFFSGVGGGNYIKYVYEDYLITLDDKTLSEKFDITYDFKNENESKNVKQQTNYENDKVGGYLKLKFDYRDNVLPRSVISFFFSNNGNDWSQIGSDHSSGTIINLIENDSYFEVGGWGDGQSKDDSYLSGFVQEVSIITEEKSRTFELNFENIGEDYFILTPEFRNIYENNITFTDEGIRLDRPRDYWVALPNDFDLSGKDFEVIIKLNLSGIPGGNETLFSQSSILRLNEDFNDQSWKWSIIDGRMYFFWIEDVTFGYSDFLGGQSLRSGQLISNNGKFDSIISDFNISQFDEITTSHSGFLTLSVEYGLVITLILLIFIVISFLANIHKINVLMTGIFLMLFVQNFTNDLIYSPDVSIYFWIIPLFNLKKLFRA